MSYYLFFKIEDQLFKIEVSSSPGRKEEMGTLVRAHPSVFLWSFVYIMSVALFIQYFNYLGVCCSFPSCSEVILYNDSIERGIGSHLVTVKYFCINS